MAQQPRRKVIFYVIAVFIGLALVETGSYCVLWFARYAKGHLLPWGKVAREVHQRDGIDLDELTRELKVLYEDDVELQPYRWFALPPNYHGQYINTDADGFRMSPPASGDAPLMGFFGGSTTFSVTTRDEQSIPAFLGAQLDPTAIQARNFGMGGFSTSAELPLLIEVARANKISVAVVYDGGEVIRYLDKI